MVEAERQLEALAFKPVLPRLAELLPRREARDGLVVGLSHQDLGERLGVDCETVTEALNELKTAGLLEIGRRRIRLLDEARLQEIADTSRTGRGVLRREAVMREIDGALAASLAAAEQLIGDAEALGSDWGKPRAPGKWSPSQIVEHIARIPSTRRWRSRTVSRPASRGSR